MALNIKDKSLPFGGQLGGSALLIVLLVISLVLVVVYSREDEGGPLHALQDTTSAVASPLSAVGTSAGSLAASASTSVEDLTASDASMSQLRENNEKLAQMVVELEEYRQEAERLESLIGLHDAYGFTSVASRVVGYSSDSYNRLITIDTGTASGVKAGLPVMGSTGVVGQVVSATPVTAQVRLLNDAQSGVAVMIQSSRAEGILNGSVEGVLYLDGVDENVEVKEGDAIITTGLGGGYFRGLVVGTVAKVEQRAGDAMRTIVVTPNASFSNISEVLVVLGMSNDAAASDDLSKANAVVAAVGPEALLAGNSATQTQTTQTDQSQSSGSNTSSSEGE